ncbi:6-bladed beta-propeller [Candidatus Oleimmundimicrobium sp.]|uniref:6-bladed beta-propeller n=1 Tax=Candidatus Oleimmundimicrobium sp. TaxID=3060597 RepID=UPI00271A57E1|nr:6-bladed beta-propeller [Candidatus Oleimmundimicrobium sp.]MDO8886203.1 6-bladed beta-propeller [Candidatus Oleimmundimicrobium sp.]
MVSFKNITKRAIKFIKKRWKHLEKKWKHTGRREHILILSLIIVLFVILLFSVFYLYGLVGFRGSQNNVPVKFIYNIGEEKGRGSLKSPLGVAISENRVYVADSANGEVKVFTSKGTFLFSFPVSGDKSTSYPVGIIVGPDKNIYVSEIKNQHLMVFDSNGKYLHDFPKKNKLTIKPLALAYANGKLYITDIGDHTVKIFDLSGKFLKSIGRSGSGIGEFFYPNGVAVDEDGKIYVADSNNGRVQVFDADGKYEYKINGEGDTKKILYLPRGIAIDNLHRIHVTDPFAHGVFVFDDEGKFLFSYGHEEGMLMAPNGIVFGPEDKKIYITDRINNSIEVWEYKH